MIHVVIGAPCSGKSTYVREHAKDGDVRVDFDAIAQTLGASNPHASDGHIRESALKARSAVIKHVCENADDCEAWIIHSSPAEWQMEKYKAASAEFIHMDTDMETCLQRCADDNRPEGTADVIRAWFEKGAKMPQYKNAPSAAESDGGSVKGYASTFDRDPDAYGDVIAKGAFLKSLERWERLGKPIPLLYGHNTDDPEYNIGAVTDIREDERGLYIEADFDADNPKAQYVRKLVKEGRLFQFSFAFEVLDAAEVTLEDGTKANELRELDIFEVSLVQIPANQHAEVVEVKSGRRNSRKDESDLRRIRDLMDETENRVDEMKEIINRLIDEPEEVPTEEPDAANEEEPTANSDEQEKANVEALLDEAKKLLQ